jgi:hypothetical protein
MVRECIITDRCNFILMMASSAFIAGAAAQVAVRLVCIAKMH